jgi:glycosyltransferase involved in cell wall biosynthesis
MLIQSPINNLGYGIAGYNIIKQLIKKMDTTIFPIGNPDPDLYTNIESHDWRNKKNIDWNETCLKIWHQNALHEMVGKKYRIGFPIFELDKFTKEEERSMESCDDILVCSRWAKDIIQEELGRTAAVVPLGVDRSIFNESNNTARPATIFFNCGKWEVRKGHDVLLRAFCETFEQNDNVELWMMCENPFIGAEGNKQWMDYYKNSKLGNKIKFIPRQKNHEDVYNIMRQVDIGVFPVRAEGWNLELLELLSCGKNIITTNYSGHTEFINKINANIIEIDEMELAQDGVWFHGQGNWAKIGDRQINQISYQMKYLHNLKRDGELGLNLAGIETARQFSWENTAKEILNGI